MLSSSSTPAEKRAALAGLADGSIGIVVGTSAVAGKSVRYRSLQLVIIDEEQRFGAAHKARLRALHSGHFLALSATPIPRTLQNALVGLQQLSVIATPPARRQPIRTVVSDWDDKSVRAALLRERARRGQSFVVVPRIADMAAIEAKLGQLTPELTVVCAHGKLSAAELDTVMTEFADGRGDVLLATNIIEAGSDVAVGAGRSCCSRTPVIRSARRPRSACGHSKRWIALVPGLQSARATSICAAAEICWATARPGI
jgi:transcription-repair coupling factor (superfamily II helicase)